MEGHGCWTRVPSLDVSWASGRNEFMRLKATSPFEGEDGLRQQSHLPQDSSKHRWGYTTPQESFIREGTNMIKFQDRLPWTGITLPLVDSFLKGRCRIFHGGKTLTSWDIIQRTASRTLFLWLQCLPPKPALLGKDKTGSRREPLTTVWIKRWHSRNWMMTPVLMTFGYGWLMHIDMLALGVCWVPSRMKSISLQWILGSVVLPKLHVGGQYPDCFEQDEADWSAPT